MMSSTIPSAKYSCSGSPLMLVNGRTAMEGLSGSGGDADVRLAGTSTKRARYACTGRPIFFSCWFPMSSKETSSLPETQLSPKVGDGGDPEGGISWGDFTPPLLHRKSDM